MTKTTEAKCNGMMLTVGFHTANPPLIWRFDLERNHSFTVSLQGEEGDWELGVTSPKGDFYSVAHFVAREDAEVALNKVGKALAEKKGSTSWLARTLAVVGVAAAFVVVLVVLFGVLVNNRLHQASAALQTPAIVQEQNGVPLSADDVLKPPPQ